MSKNMPYLWRHSQKKTKPKTKNFFSLQTRRLAESFEDLNSSLPQSSVEIFPHKNMCKLLDMSLSLTEAKVLTTIAFNHKPVAIETTGTYSKFTNPFLSGLVKKLVDMYGDSWEWQWYHKRLFLPVVKGNAASILTCVQVWSDFRYSQCTNQYYYLPLAFVSMHSYCLLNVCGFCKLSCPLCSFISLICKLSWLPHSLLWWSCNNVICSTFLETCEVISFHNGFNHYTKVTVIVKLTLIDKNFVTQKDTSFTILIATFLTKTIFLLTIAMSLHTIKYLFHDSGCIIILHIHWQDL